MSAASDTAPLKIGVLLCDHTPPELRHHIGGDYDDLFTAFLTTAADACGVSVALSFFDAVDGSLPEHRDECDAWVVTGSRHDAYADDGWIDDLRLFIRDVIEADGRIAGICFGHQLVAIAMGGSVQPSGHWSIGPQRLALGSTPWFAESEVYLHAMHRDVVTVLPPGATVIGEGTTAQVPAYLLGDNVLCVQDHPEFPAEFVSALIEARTARIGADEASRAQETIRHQPTDGPEIGESIIRFLHDDRTAATVVSPAHR